MVEELVARGNERDMIKHRHGATATRHMIRRPDRKSISVATLHVSRAAVATIHRPGHARKRKGVATIVPNDVAVAVDCLRWAQ